MKKWLALPLAFAFVCLARAQNTPQSFTLKGIAIDSATRQPIGFVTVVLQQTGSERPIKTAVTKPDGSFVIKAPMGKPFGLVFSCVGYTNKSIPVTPNSEDSDLGRIRLMRAIAQLKEASVNAVKPIVTREVDRLSYNIQADPEVASLSVLEMMRKVPMLDVDGDDHILLNGNSNYKILINGKESAMMAKSPSDILKAMPATNIERIEVYTTPPAKYDAEGLAGIINIITKRNAVQGYNISIDARENTVNGPNGAVSAAMKQGKFGASVFGLIVDQANVKTNSTTTEDLFSDNSTIRQQAANYRHALFHDGSMELSYEFDSLHLLTASGNFFQQTTYTGSTQFSSIDSVSFVQQGYTLQNNSREKYLSVEAGLNYQLGFKRSKKALLTFSYLYSYAPDEKLSNNAFSDRINYATTVYPDYQQYDSEGTTSHTLQLDYTGPLGKLLSTEAGAKAIFRSDYSNYYEEDQDSATGKYVLNPRQTNDFRYQQDIYSLYNSYQLNIKKWTGKGGLRLEHTAVNADFSSEGVSVAPSYNNLIPSLSLQRNFAVSTINFGYTQRIQRPGISQLSPYVNLTNPLFISTGNPGLRPELDNNFEFTYNRFGKNSIIAGISYAFSNNSIQQVASLRPDSANNKDTVNYTTFENLGANRTLGANLNTRFNYGKSFSLGVNARIFYTWLKGAYNGQLYMNQGAFGNAFINARYKFNDGYVIGLNAGWFSRRITLQGSSEGRFISQYLVSKELFKKKGTLTLVSTNPYARFLTIKTTTHAPDFTQVSANQVVYRTFAIRFNYRFGKLNSEIKKNQRGINNDDLKQSEKSSGTNQ